MNIFGIINRPSQAVYSIEELSFVVESYIEQVKGKRVKINLMKGLPTHGFFVQTQLPRQIKGLNYAFNVAQAYFKKQYKNDIRN